ncbi:hypothetical protein B0T26DRAFT_731969 [Lasiosphaeria miniovina]|uniref:Uncharacterized protein n=1 Tax=Lasiosphaeria miniovina TaxID=1954250 RepID=A0AA39ZU59_9PEZI|nr:uncharacterized protein B0T26DRAFT_731969 [Lasiosphaeria miniovina]KAK0703584.1 hypothetical protein B0T26DRAFT_731969 [Lasiosphaeria miniovina]
MVLSRPPTSRFLSLFGKQPFGIPMLPRWTRSSVHVLERGFAFHGIETLGSPRKLPTDRDSLLGREAETRPEGLSHAPASGSQLTHQHQQAQTRQLSGAASESDLGKSPAAINTNISSGSCRRVWSRILARTFEFVWCPRRSLPHHKIQIRPDYKMWPWSRLLCANVSKGGPDRRLPTQRTCSLQQRRIRPGMSCCGMVPRCSALAAGPADANHRTYVFNRITNTLNQARLNLRKLTLIDFTTQAHSPHI